MISIFMGINKIIPKTRVGDDMRKPGEFINKNFLNLLEDWQKKTKKFDYWQKKSFGQYLRKKTKRLIKIEVLQKKY